MMSIIERAREFGELILLPDLRGNADGTFVENAKNGTVRERCKISSHSFFPEDATIERRIDNQSTNRPQRPFGGML